MLDSRSAKYVLWSNFVLILWKSFGLSLFGFLVWQLVWQLVWARNQMRIFVFVILCNQKEGCSLQSLGAGGGTSGSIFVGYVPLACQNPYPFIVYSVAYCRPYFCYF